MPKLDDDADETSFVEDEDDDDEEDEEQQNNHLDDESSCRRRQATGQMESGGIKDALRACCCCCSRSDDIQKPVIPVDPENGTVISVGSHVPPKETFCDKFMDVWRWFRSHLKSFIYCFWFENGIMLCIIINTLCLALDSPGISKDMDAVLSKINDVSINKVYRTYTVKCIVFSFS